MPRIRVLLAEDHTPSREFIRSLLEAEFDVVGAVSDGLELLEACERLTPDVVVTDVRMPNLDGIRATERLLTRQAGVPVVLLTFEVTDEVFAAGRRAGASEFVAKTSASSALPPAIRRAARRP